MHRRAGASLWGAKHKGFWVVEWALRAEWFWIGFSIWWLWVVIKQLPKVGDDSRCFIRRAHIILLSRDLPTVVVALILINNIDTDTLNSRYEGSPSINRPSYDNNNIFLSHKLNALALEDSWMQPRTKGVSGVPASPSPSPWCRALVCPRRCAGPAATRRISAFAAFNRSFTMIKAPKTTQPPDFQKERTSKLASLQEKKHLKKTLHRKPLCQTVFSATPLLHQSAPLSGWALPHPTVGAPQRLGKGLPPACGQFSLDGA